MGGSITPPAPRRYSYSLLRSPFGLSHPVLSFGFPIAQGPSEGDNHGSITKTHFIIDTATGRVCPPVPTETAGRVCAHAHRNKAFLWTKTQDTLDYYGKAPGDLPRTAAKETRGRAPAYANASIYSSASSASESVWFWSRLPVGPKVSLRPTSRLRPATGR